MGLPLFSDAVKNDPVLRLLTFNDISHFVRTACLAKPAIELYTKDRRVPPMKLPDHILNVLAGVLQCQLKTIHAYWRGFRNAVWDHGEITPSDSEITRFNQFGVLEGIGMCIIPFIGL